MQSTLWYGSNLPTSAIGVRSKHVLRKGSRAHVEITSCTVTLLRKLSCLQSVPASCLQNELRNGPCSKHVKASPNCFINIFYVGWNRKVLFFSFVLGTWSFLLRKAIIRYVSFSMLGVTWRICCSFAVSCPVPETYAKLLPVLLLKFQAVPFSYVLGINIA